MPITLGCPSCGKRFRARDESAGKRVKCPYCQAAVPVPTAEESASAGAPTDVVAPAPVPGPSPFGGSGAGGMPPPRPTAPAAPPPPVPVSSADEWGAGGLQLTADQSPPPIVLQPASVSNPGPAIPARPAVMARPEPLPDDTGPTVARGRPDPRRRPPPAPTRGEKKQAAALEGAGGWRKANGGLTWVLIGLFFLALPGFVPFGKQVYARSVGELPTDKDAGMVVIEGYINGNDKDAVKVSKLEELNALAYGLPVLLGGFALTIGRLTAGAAPRDSGAKGLYAFSGMLTLLALVGLVTHVVCLKYSFPEVAAYGLYAFAFGAIIAEFWFLLALSASNGALENPAGVRAVGLVGLIMGLGVIVYFDVFKYETLWTEYAKLTDRPKKPEPDSQLLLWEAGAGMLGWLLLVGVYWRAVRGTKDTIEDSLADAAPPKPKAA